MNILLFIIDLFELKEDFSVTKYCQVARAYEQLAYATYVNEYSAGKSDVNFIK